MVNLTSLLGLVLSLGSGSIALGASLFTPFSMDSAAVLPKGVRNLRVVGFTAQVADKYNGAYGIAPVGEGFNKRVTVGELINSQPAGFERGKLKGGLEGLGVEMDQTAGETFGAVNSRVTTTIPVFAMGVTDRLTLGFAVPIIYTNTSVRTGWNVDPRFEKQIQGAQGQGYANRILAFQDKLRNVVEAQVAADGYQPLGDQSLTEIGDVQLAAKYQIAKAYAYGFTISPRLSVPTGRSTDPNKLIDVAPGTGTYNATLAGIMDYIPAAHVTVSPSVSYTYPIAARRAIRVPTSFDQTLTPDVDSNSTFKAGDILGFGLAGRFEADDQITIGAGYNYQYKGPDRYSGDAYDGNRYGYLSKETEQRMHAAQISLTYGTLALYKKHQFLIPLEATLGLATTFAGQNVNRASLTSLDLAAYF